VTILTPPINPMLRYNPTGGAAEPFRLKAGFETIAVAKFPPDGIAALSFRRGIPSMVEERGTSTQSYKLPSGFLTEPFSWVLLAADSEQVVLLAENDCRIHDAGGWRPLPMSNWPDFGKFKRGHRSVPSHLCLHESRIYVAYDFGEWGGAVFSLGLAGGGWRRESDGVATESPQELTSDGWADWIAVNAMKVSPDGTLWVIRGESFAGRMPCGVVQTHKDGKWTTLSAVNSFGEKWLNWPYTTDVLLDVDFDAQGRACVLSRYGLTRFEQEGPVSLSSGWNDTNNYPLSVAIGPDGNAYVGTYATGLLRVTNLESSPKVEVIGLLERFPDSTTPVAER